MEIQYKQRGARDHVLGVCAVGRVRERGPPPLPRVPADDARRSPVPVVGRSPAARVPSPGGGVVVRRAAGRGGVCAEGPSGV